ncbi:spliced leader RNA PSE-promoter transcription factor, putative [Trypanosoma brucei brucei TREU927]|uniref:Spliced leader RNA PSE-promoter transcription factor, putative n=1 Tax=Trypanosoma brucei brucei (strain 927/4 GUTat10.1) TaxID=185431 RepID=Q57WR3_TRYB2|nr:spliced leader RNA PSE-promoter transcription factor, putative [Trypanosoma brucei brucei TREU927]AAX69929.1 spliced leader RNA PSE-promoter transcription factor, putative [Trypanosoma brucei]AAZ12202.1 spliced leader RNA PSE-promoter transcription factor, putative [Trypanosoma brucei brucei TREU927]
MRSSANFFLANSSSGGLSKYRPRFRPRRLVLPVNPSDVHSISRANNPMYAKYQEGIRLRRRAERRGVIALSFVPSERSVGDAFRIMVEVCEKEGFFESKSSTPNYLRKVRELIKRAETELGTGERVKNTSANPSFYDIGLSEARDLSRNADKSRHAEGNIETREIDSLWSLLNATPLDSPVHGILALRGKALLESIIANTVQQQYPRLRSKHLQEIIHECCSLLACGRAAFRLGFADVCGINGEINMWRELNVLTERFNTARHKAAAHLQRVEKGVTQQRRWYWRGVLRSSSKRLKQFPVRQGDLLPRMEWIRESVYAFVAFVDLAEKSGDNVRVVPLIENLFCGQISSFVSTNQTLKKAHRMVDMLSKARIECDATTEKEKIQQLESLSTDIENELAALEQFTDDELGVMSRVVHPLNARSDNRKEQFSSSGGAHAVQSLRDDIFDDYRVTRHNKEAPPMVINCMRPQNALKEAQIILRYDPNVSETLSSSPIDVDQVIRRVTEVHETNSYATLYNFQQFRQVEYTVCRLYAGKRCIGQGKGETLMEAVNEAAQHTLLNYYLKDVSNANSREKEEDAVTEAFSATPPELTEVRVKEATEEEVIF